VERARAATLEPLAASELGDLLRLLADPVRLRALFCLAEVEELCVGDVAQAIDVNVDQSSYALRSLKAARLATTRRNGRVIYYRLADDFPKSLVQHCLGQLLTITTDRSAR
jgi:DNA-binding transcriptional ArsR family regulator